VYRDDQVNRELYLATRTVYFWLCHACPFVCQYVSTWLPLYGFSWYLVLEYFINICREYLKLFEIGQIMRNINFKEFVTNGYIFPYYDN